MMGASVLSKLCLGQTTPGEIAGLIRKELASKLTMNNWHLNWGQWRVDGLKEWDDSHFRGEALDIAGLRGSLLGSDWRQ